MKELGMVERHVFSKRCKRCYALPGDAKPERTGDANHCTACGAYQPPPKVNKQPAPAETTPKWTEKRDEIPAREPIPTMSVFDFWWAELNKYFAGKGCAHLLAGQDKSDYHEYFEDGDSYAKILEIERNAV